MDMLNEGTIDVQSMGVKDGMFVFRQGSRYFGVKAQGWKPQSIDSEFTRILREKDGFAARQWLKSIRAIEQPIQYEQPQVAPEQPEEPPIPGEATQWERMGNPDSPAKTNDTFKRPHNQRAYQEAKQSIAETGRACIVQATGTGKSSIFTALMDDYSDTQCVFVSPKQGINDQFVRHQMDNDVSKNGNLETTMYQSILAQYKDNPRFSEFHAKYDIPIGLLCIDEEHHIKAPWWGEALDAFIEEFCDENTVIVGATATPDKKATSKLFKGTVSNYTLEQAVADGELPMCTYINVPRIDPKVISKLYDLKKIDPLERKACQEELDAILGPLDKDFQKERNQYMIEQLRKQHKDGKGFKVLGFFGTTADAQDSTYMIEILKEAFPDMTINASSYTSDDKKKTQGFFDRFVSEDEKDQPKDGEILLLSAVGMFSEGIHAPGVNTIFMGRNTESNAIYDQQIGRVLSVGNKEGAYVYDLVNNVEDSQHDWMSIYESAKANGHAEGVDEPYLDHAYEDALKEALVCIASHKKGKAKLENGIYNGKWTKINDAIDDMCAQYNRKPPKKSVRKVIVNYIKTQIEMNDKSYDEAIKSIKNCSFF